MTKHTPGPWSSGPYGPLHRFLDGHMPSWGPTQSKWSPGPQLDDAGNRELEHKEHQANAVPDRRIHPRQGKPPTERDRLTWNRTFTGHGELLNYASVKVEIPFFATYVRNDAHGFHRYCQVVECHYRKAEGK